MTTQCNGSIYLPNRLIDKGVDNRCHNFAYKLCSYCGKYYCHNHITRSKHLCDELENMQKEGH